MTQRILLVGMMGVGKTTVGRLVADKLGWRYLDSDTEVQQATGMTVPELFAEKGEEAFREAEAEALRRACTATEASVVSVAGGAVLRADNRALIASAGLVVWLRARPATLAARVGDGSGRPLLAGDPLETLTALNAVRAPFYAEVATITFDVDDLSAGDVASRVQEQVTT
ncbi:MAG TPA: shikimate kinase [Acidimicrobiales bacterium]|nr:shikimate kinase [Acidimicrobiales bacterium]